MKRQRINLLRVTLIFESETILTIRLSRDPIFLLKIVSFAPSINLQITENCNSPCFSPYFRRLSRKSVGFRDLWKYVNASIRLFVSQAGARRVQCRFEINRGREEIARAWETRPSRSSPSVEYESVGTGYEWTTLLDVFHDETGLHRWMEDISPPPYLSWALNALEITGITN